MRPLDIKGLFSSPTTDSVSARQIGCLPELVVDGETWRVWQVKFFVELVESVPVYAGVPESAKLGLLYASMTAIVCPAPVP